MIQSPVRDFPITKSGGVPEDRVIGWMESVTAMVNLLTPIEGTGSPEGVVFSPARAYFFDTVGARLYFKTTDKSLSTGWVELT